MAWVEFLGHRLLPPMVSTLFGSCVSSFRLYLVWGLHKAILSFANERRNEGMNRHLSRAGPIILFLFFLAIVTLFFGYVTFEILTRSARSDSERTMHVCRLQPVPSTGGFVYSPRVGRAMPRVQAVA